MARKEKRRSRADRERSTERERSRDEEERAAESDRDSAAGTPLGVPDATIPDATLPDAGLPDCSVPDAGFGGASIPIQRSEGYSQADTEPENTTTDVTFPDPQIQSKFKHAPAFGVEENWNMESKERFKTALKAHIADPETTVIEGKYQDKPAIHYYNTQTKNVVITKPDRRFWTCWTLSTAQEKHLHTTGKIGGR